MPNVLDYLLEAEKKPAVSAAKGLLGFAPGIGDAISGYDALQSARQGNYGEAALNALGLLPFIPSLGGVIKSAKGAEQAAETLYRGVQKEGQKSSTGALFLTPDRSYAAKYGTVGEYTMSPAKTLDLSQFKGVDRFEDVYSHIGDKLGYELADRLFSGKSVRVNGKNEMDVYSLLRDKSNIDALKEAGVDVVRYKQLSDGADARSVAVLNQSILKKK